VSADSIRLPAGCTIETTLAASAGSPRHPHAWL
jgi:hypothetical protein